jgi:hypothetical protein
MSGELTPETLARLIDAGAFIGTRPSRKHYAMVLAAAILASPEMAAHNAAMRAEGWEAARNAEPMDLIARPNPYKRERS